MHFSEVVFPLFSACLVGMVMAFTLNVVNVVIHPMMTFTTNVVLMVSIPK